MMRHLPSILLVLVTAFVVGQAAASTVDCEVITVKASSAGRGMDPALEVFAAVLGKPPFAVFDTFELVGKHKYKLDLDRPQDLQLPDGLLGSLVYRGASKGMLSLRLELIPQGKAPIRIDGSASPGAPLFAAGLKGPTGTLVFAVACRDKELQLVQ